MANLIQATVYQIDGNPLPSSVVLDFQTSDILVREATINIAAVNSSIRVYDVPNNGLGFKTYYVSETVSSLTTSANANGLVTLTQATVLEISSDPQPPGGVQYGFPSQEILIASSVNPTTGVNATITYKSTNYSVAETQATLFSNSNPTAGGVGGGGAANQIAIWSGPSTLNGNGNLTWLPGSPNTLLVAGIVSVNTSGQAYTISTRYGANSDGRNIWIGGGGSSSIGNVGQPFKGSNNVSFGYEALLSATTAYQNVAIGSNALRVNNTGENNIAIGFTALTNNQTGGGNIAIGSSALFSNTSSNGNIAIGLASLNLTTAGSNVAIGGASMQFNVGGTGNTSIGSSTLSYNINGSSNISIGLNAGSFYSGGFQLTQSTNSIFIGANAKSLSNSSVNEIVIGNNTGAGNNTTTIGNTTTLLTVLSGEVRPTNLVNLGSAATQVFVPGVANTIKVRTATEFRADIGALANVGGAGSINYLPKYSGSALTMGNSQIQDDGTNIGYSIAPNAQYRHNFGAVGFIVNFETGTNGKIRIGSSFATDADGYIAAPFGNFIYGTNIYYSQPNFVYGKNGYGVYTQMEATTGTFTVLTAPLNSSGTGAIATPVGRFTIFNSGNAVINKLVDAGWKLDIAATTDGLRVTGSGTTSATSGLKVETSGGTSNFQVLDNGNCGIRVSAPTARLHISTGGATTASLGLKVRNSADSIDILSTFGTSQVIINSTSGSLSTSAQLQIDSTTRGFLPPRMTNAQMNGISTPANGLIVYDTDNNSLCVWDGIQWFPLNP